MSKIMPGMLVACEVYGGDRPNELSMPMEKRGLGRVIGETDRTGAFYETSDKSFQVEMLYPPYLKGTKLGMLESSLMLLVDSLEAKMSLQDGLPDIILSLVREIDRLKRRVESSCRKTIDV